MNSKHNIKLKPGFTIVELLVVVVVISILVAVTVVVYGNIATRAKNSARISVGEQWVRLFKLHQAQVERMPQAFVVTNDSYKFCLGTGFPIGGGGVPRCQNVGGTNYNSPAESDNAALMDELRTIGSLPSAQPVRTSAGLVGPYATKISGSSYITISIALDGTYVVGAECGGGFVSEFTEANVSVCRKIIRY